MTFYLNVFIITELLMLAMTFHVLHYSGFNKIQKVWFIVTFLVIMFNSAAEYAVHCGYYDKIFAIPLTILTVIQFSISPVLAMLFTGALGLNYQGRIAIIFFGVNLLIETIAAPFGWVFSFTETGYERGPLFLVLYGLSYVLSLGYLVVSLFFVGRKFRHRDAITIIAIMVVLVAGIIPMSIFKINVAYLAIAIGSSICYIYYNDLVQEDMKAELVAHQKKMSAMQENIISGLANLIESRDIETGEHVARTSLYVKLIAENAKKDGVYSNVIDDHFISLLFTLAPMHDVGKIVVSDKILKKPGKLTPAEYEEMKKHASEGGNVVRKILSNITDEEYLDFASNLATYHHERWDGSGYPKGLKGEEIPLEARIMSIADVFDALISKRCYKEAIPIDEAIEIIKQESGTHFDSKLVDIFLKYQDQFVEVSKKDLNEG